MLPVCCLLQWMMNVWVLPALTMENVLMDCGSLHVTAQTRATKEYNVKTVNNIYNMPYRDSIQWENSKYKM